MNNYQTIFILTIYAALENFRGTVYKETVDSRKGDTVMIKAIFFDIDGTLVSFKTHKPTESAMRALWKLHENGIKVFLATGRQPLYRKWITGNFKGFPFDGYVMLNGQYCADQTGEPFYQMPIPQEAFVSLIPWLEANPDVVCGFSEIDYNYMNRINDAVKTAMEKLGAPLNPVEDPVRSLTNPTYQLNPYIPEERDDEFIEHAPGCKSVRWSDTFADIIPASGGKPEGIKRMLDRWGFTREECMAFGDGGNDIAMLEIVHSRIMK